MISLKDAIAIHQKIAMNQLTPFSEGCYNFEYYRSSKLQQNKLSCEDV